MVIRLPDWIQGFNEKKESICLDGATADCRVDLAEKGKHLIASITANDSPVSFVVLKWKLTGKERRDGAVRVFGDTWERGYGTFEWRGTVPERNMPWYFLVSNGSDSDLDASKRFTECFGVMVRPGAFCYWQYDGASITLVLDIRNGSHGVVLKGRTLCMAEIVFSEYSGVSAFESGKRFCAELCPDPIFPDSPVYGFNDWYYSYGNSTSDSILADSERLKRVSDSLSNRPYMVIDDGWQKNWNDGPWDCGNERFPDMRGLAKQIREKQVRPGIWIRPLCQKAETEKKFPDAWRLQRFSGKLDPSHPEVLDYIGQTVRNITEWGYELIKYDFVTYDIFGKWGFSVDADWVDGEWGFYNPNLTTAEIILQLYQTIRDASEKAILIGCNAIGHLCAGLVHINRTGDDTSGREWSRTRKMGVNTLAFRQMQNRAFYIADADCVGITHAVPWEQNKKWLELLANSGSPLFISWDPACGETEVERAVKEALRINSNQTDQLIPLDWMETICPSKWMLNGKVIDYSWLDPSERDNPKIIKLSQIIH